MMRIYSRIHALAGCFALAVPFETGKAGWKMDGDKLALDANGNPIYVKEDGSEQSVKNDTIARLNDEGKAFRERAEKAEKTLKAYEVDGGKLLDPEAARKAVDTIKNIDAKKLIDAGEVDKLREQMKSEFQAQLSEKDSALNASNSLVSDMRVDKVFSNSEFIRENLAMPRDFFEASMRKHFKDEDGKVMAYDRTGNRLMSKKNSGEYADPEEALQLLVEMHPQKDTILKAPDQRGTGNGGGGGNRGGGRFVSRAAFDAMGQADKAAAGQAIAKGEMAITD